MNVYIYNAKRSPIGKFKKSLHETGCRELGKQVSKSLFDCNISPTDVDKVYVGNVLSAGLGQNIARQILIDSEIPEDRCATSVNMVCGSGLKAISLAFNEIKLGNANLVLAGGVENMSMSPLLKNRYNDELELTDSMIYDSLSDIFNECHMGVTAENIASKYSVSREEQDLFSFESQMKVKKALTNNIFREEITPIIIDNVIFEKDEFPRTDTTIDKLASLKPAFLENGTVTAGNSSGINDGCSFLLIGNDKIDSKPLAEIIDFAEVGCNPKYMGMGPYYAISNLLKKNNLDLFDIDLYEINEAFASQSIAVIKELANKFNVSYDEFKEKINVNGGAIALGHPVGASGARILTTLIYEMKRRKSKYGIASLCIGGGMGIAILVKNIDEEKQL